jgi:hypothetical protein
MYIAEYLVRCPKCRSRMRLCAEITTPLMIYCHGCERFVILTQEYVYTLPFDMVYDILADHDSRSCGKLLSVELSKSAKELINRDKIMELKNLLDQPLDVKDFIKKIN